MYENTQLRLHYLFKVVLGLSLLLLALVAAGLLADTSLNRPSRYLAAVVLVLPFLALIPFSTHLYRSADELRKEMHARASMFCVSVSIAAAGVAAVLQLLGLLPNLKLIWVFFFLIGTWGLGLMLADRKHH